MTDIEQKMQTLLDEARIGIPLASEWAIQRVALRRAIEQHEAFRQEVSDAVENVTQRQGKLQSLLRFIIAKPDPLVEAFDVVWPGIDKVMVEALRAAIEKRGGKIVWGEG